jgi:rod shape-determining protein MreD
MRAAVAQTLRTDVSVYRFHPAAVIGIPLLALFVQAFLPIKLHMVSWLDLPLLVTIFFAISRRNQVQGLVTGGLIGVLQDSLTSLPIGIYGLAKTLVGFFASSLSVKIDSENPGSRILITFGFYLLHQAVYFTVARKMVQLDLQWQWHQILLAAVLNAVFAVPLFWALDRLKQRA